MDALPAPRTPDPAAAPPLRWGVLGTGWIAERFVAALLRSTRQQVAAVGSRDLPRSRAFADRFGVARAYGSYEDLVADDDLDVVYVATPHNAHRPCARLALEAGRHCLVEKPIGLNAGEARELADLAAGRGLFCMEALWSLFLPKFDVLRQLLAAGALGEVRTVLADMGEHFGPDHRIMSAALAGGPLLDLGTYPVMLATEVLGEPDTVLALGRPTEAGDGVNGQTAILLGTAAGQQAVLHTTLFSDTDTRAVIAGTEGTLSLDGPFYQPGPFTLTRYADGQVLRHDEPAVAHEALHFQAAEVARCVDAGLRESPLRTLAATVRTMAVLDEVRRQVGIVFAEERG